MVVESQMIHYQIVRMDGAILAALQERVGKYPDHSKSRDIGFE